MIVIKTGAGSLPKHAVRTLGIGPFVIVGGVMIVYAFAFNAVADDVLIEVRDELPGRDKDAGGYYKHCVATCLITLRVGNLCGVVASKAPEVSPGNVFDWADIKAGLDGFACANEIQLGWLRIWDASRVVNPWLECQWCCRQKGYPHR